MKLRLITIVTLTSAIFAIGSCGNTNENNTNLDTTSTKEQELKKEKTVLKKGEKLFEGKYVDSYPTGSFESVDVGVEGKNGKEEVFRYYDLVSGISKGDKVEVIYTERIEKMLIDIIVDGVSMQDAGVPKSNWKRVEGKISAVHFPDAEMQDTEDASISFISTDGKDYMFDVYPDKKYSSTEGKQAVIFYLESVEKTANSVTVK